MCLGNQKITQKESKKDGHRSGYKIYKKNKILGNNF